MKYTYSFEEGNKNMRDLLGGKGANLCEMTNLNLPVPKGFIVTTETCKIYYENDNKITDEIINQIFNEVEKIENKTNKKLGDKNNPLLLSVRSGARESMPGMMDSVLNLGFNDDILEGFSNKRFAYDCYRRLIQMFSDVVKGYDKSNFERVIDEIKKEKNIKYDIELTEEDMKNIVLKFKSIYKEVSNEEFPQDPKIQLTQTIEAVFKSWNNERAKIYRKMNNISDDLGTAVNIQEMVYGNIDENSGTGVAFSRNPSTGENELYGEFLINAQGEDVVAGVRTPNHISKLKEIMPNIYDEFYNIAKMLENHYKDMQDMEFTIEKGKLYILQTRNGKRTMQASINIVVDLVNEGMISKEDAILRIDSKKLDQLLHPIFNEEELKNTKILAKGITASPGAGSGKIYFNSEDVKKAKENNEETILVRLETSPEDIEGMNNANGILTIRGGMTSHAAVVARGMGKCCVSGVEEIKIDENSKTLTFNDGTILNEGDYVSIDGTTGNVYSGKINTKNPEIEGNFNTFMSWVDEFRRLKVRANADNEEDALIARKFGAEGIGLCRTEHMFFKEERIFNFRKMILSKTMEEREKDLEKIIPYQIEDFEELFRQMKDYPVIIRYLDPPLHEFLPKEDNQIKLLSEDMNVSVSELKNRINKLKEFNPMMGHRGCRLSITYPEIAKMQTKAVIQSAINVKREGIDVIPEIMIPLVSDVNEFKYIKQIVCEEANQVLKNQNINMDYKVGAMIEVPRAALLAGELAKEADFFSFGTNDLTQMTYGFSRDDSSKFLNDYYNKSILKTNPFEKIDQEGVGVLVAFAKEKARNIKNDISLGICGEHAAEESSIEFCNKIGLDYVSCSSYRIPAARLAAAQVEIKQKRAK